MGAWVSGRRDGGWKLRIEGLGGAGTIGIVGL